MSLLNPSDVSAFVAQNIGFYGDAHGRMQRIHDLYYGHLAYLGLQLPQGVKIHESGTAAHSLDAVKDQIRTEDPVVEAKQLKKGEAGRKLTEGQQQWAQAALRRIASDELLDPFEQAKTDLCMRGCTAVKVTPKRQVISPLKQGPDEKPGDFKERQRLWEQSQATEFPFEVKAVDPMHRLYPSPGTGPVKYMIDSSTQPVTQVKAQYPKWSDPLVKSGKVKGEEAADPTRRATVYEIWTWGWDEQKERYDGRYIVNIDGDTVENAPNPHRMVPYEFRYSGLGRMNYDSDPRYLSVSVLDTIVGELESEIRVKTAMDAQWQFHVFPRLVVKGISAQDAARRFMKGPGAVVELPTDAGADIKWLEQAAPNPVMLGFLDRVMQNISGKINPALSGERTADFGVHQALQIGQAIKSITPIKESLNRVAEGVLEKMAQLAILYNIKMDYQGGTSTTERSLAPSKVAAAKFVVDFKATDPAEDNRFMLAALSVFNAGGLMSKATFRKHFMRLLVPDNDEEEATILGEQAMDQFVATGALGQLLTQRLQMAEQQAQLSQQEADLSRQLQESSRSLGDDLTNVESFPVDPIPGAGAIAAGQQQAGV